MTQKEKTKFRSTSTWKKWRIHIKKLFNNKDAITHQPLHKGFNIHHLDEPHYNDLKDEKFIPLNKQTHDVIHWLARYDNYEEIADLLVHYVKIMKTNK